VGRVEGEHQALAAEHDVWLLLVGERGWTAGQWERWFADTACAQLLGG
jgi:hypothetical protein